VPAVGLDPDGAGGEGDPVAVAALLREPRESDTAALPVTGTGGLPVPVGIYRAGYGIVTSRKQRRSRRQLPAQPGPGGHALDGGLRGGTGHGPVSPGHGRAELRAHQSRQRRWHVPAGRAGHRVA